MTDKYIEDLKDAIAESEKKVGIRQSTFEDAENKVKREYMANVAACLAQGLDISEAKIPSKQAVFSTRRELEKAQKKLEQLLALQARIRAEPAVLDDIERFLGI